MSHSSDTELSENESSEKQSSENESGADIQSDDDLAFAVDGIQLSQHWPAATLYIVATPIGNRHDISSRAVQVLQRVDLIAAEDTRHSGGLLKHYLIDTPMVACHDHNEDNAAQLVIGRLAQGQCVALISDAGTPLISDPGYKIVRLVREQGFRVAPIPGACAMICALSASGLPTDRFVFEGFLSSKREARQKRLQQLSASTATMVFYEAPHRIVSTLQAMAVVFGGERKAVLARELTKRYETIIDANLADLAAQVDADRNQQRGEMVIIVHGAGGSDEDRSEVEREADRVLSILLAELGAKQAAGLAVKLTGLKKNYLYQRAIDMLSADKS